MNIVWLPVAQFPTVNTISPAAPSRGRPERSSRGGRSTAVAVSGQSRGGGSCEWPEQGRGGAVSGQSRGGGLSLWAGQCSGGGLQLLQLWAGQCSGGGLQLLQLWVGQSTKSGIIGIRFHAHTFAQFHSAHSSAAAVVYSCTPPLQAASSSCKVPLHLTWRILEHSSNISATAWGAGIKR